MRKLGLISGCFAAAIGAVNAYYRLDTLYQGKTFFDGFDFYDGDDYTHGFVDYVSRSEAESAGLIWSSDNQIYMGADMTNIAYSGRKSIRIESKARYTEGLFIMEMAHMPTGCGTWPAYWLCGPDWPNAGEIDIVEGVDNQQAVLTTLHTSAGCAMYSQDTSLYTGSMSTFDCDVSNPWQPTNAGCSIQGAAGTYGANLNSVGGGVFATEWTKSYIAVWYWPVGQIPSNVYETPDTASWGKPYAYFTLGDNCPASHFHDHSIIFDLTFCGDWDGATFPTNCPNLGSCTDYVMWHPEAFVEAYWLVNYVKVFKWADY